MDTQTITIQKMTFTAPKPYTEGHTLTGPEASVLNQTLAENLRNNFGARIKRIIEENEALQKEGKPLKALPTQADFDTYAAEYKFGERVAGEGRVVLDPVEREARSLAKTALTEALKKQGKKVKDLADGVLDSLIDKVLESKPEFRAKAEQIVASRNSAIGDLSELGL